MRPLLSDISSVIVTDLLPKKAIKHHTNCISHAKKNIYPFNSSFHFCLISLIEWVSWAKRTLLEASLDLKYSNDLIHFLVNLSPLTLFVKKAKLIAGITCIYVKLRYTFPWQFKYESRNTRFEENFTIWNYQRHV